MSNNRIGKKLTATAAMAVALAAIAPTWSVAQPAPPVAGAPVSAAPGAVPAGVPDMNGIYYATTGFSYTPNNPRGAKQHPPLTPEYAKIYADHVAAADAGLPTGDPTANCLPQGMPRFMNMPFGFEILQTPKQINFTSEWNEQTRRIYMDGRGHPADLEPSYNGHSIGHWEGDTLVIETVGLRADTVLDASGIPHSDITRVVERIRFVDPVTLHADVTIYDRKAFTIDWTVTKVYKLQKDHPGLKEYICLENNRNPVNEKGQTTTILPK
jgi:hypothetical protein